MSVIMLMYPYFNQPMKVSAYFIVKFVKFVKIVENVGFFSLDDKNSFWILLWKIYLFLER